jgi:hypothetical protein
VQSANSSSGNITSTPNNNGSIICHSTLFFSMGSGCIAVQFWSSGWRIICEDSVKCLLGFTSTLLIEFLFFCNKSICIKVRIPAFLPFTGNRLRLKKTRKQTGKIISEATVKMKSRYGRNPKKIIKYAILLDLLTRFFTLIPKWWCKTLHLPHCGRLHEHEERLLHGEIPLSFKRFKQEGCY